MGWAHRAKALQERAEKTMAGVLKDLAIATFEWERIKEALVELLAELDATKAERDEALNDTEGVILAKRDLERALEETTTEATNLHLQKLNAEASIRWLSDQVAHALEEALNLSSKLGTVKIEAAILRSQVSSLGVKEAELLARLESL
ncbi:hypothetical protein ACLOJK_041467 [Asimina triloba]